MKNLLLLLFGSLAMLCAIRIWPAPANPQYDSSVVSEHIRLQVPSEREWLARDVNTEFERAWSFLRRAVGTMPRRVLFIIDWKSPLTTTDSSTATVRLGMNSAAAAADPKSFALHAGTREMARLALIDLSGGGAESESASFLLEGMSEILVHEYNRSTRNLEGAWVVARLLQQMKLLGFAQQFPWTGFAAAQHSLRTVAPGITFLETCRELRGRESLIKLFEALGKSPVEIALFTVFKTNAAALEKLWLEKVANYDAPEEVTATAPEDAPDLNRVVFMPGTARAGNPFQARLYLGDRIGDLLPEAVFVNDKASGKTLQGRASSDEKERYVSVDLPVEAGRTPGSYELSITAIDEAGNVRTWTRSYTVEP
jgi:hypothetical protein